MKAPFVPSRKSFGRDITKRPGSGDIAKRTYVCNGCGLWHVTKPAQCVQCGRMDFETFQSKDEAARWAQLLLLLRIGKIKNLKRHTRYDLLAFGPEGQPVKVAAYEDDFSYDRVEGGAHVIEDVKPHGLDRFAAIKLQWMAAQGITVTVVKMR